MRRNSMLIVPLVLLWSHTAFAAKTLSPAGFHFTGGLHQIVHYGGSFWISTLLLFALTLLLPAMVFIIRKKQKPINNKYELLRRSPYIYVLSWLFILCISVWCWFLCFILPVLHHGMYTPKCFPHSILFGIIFCSFWQLFSMWIFVKMFCRYI